MDQNKRIFRKRSIRSLRFVIFLSCFNFVRGNYLYYLDQLILHYITGGHNKIEGKTLPSLKNSRTDNESLSIDLTLRRSEGCVDGTCPPYARRRQGKPLYRIGEAKVVLLISMFSRL